VKVKKVVRKEIDHDADGVHVAGGINAVIAANVNESGSTHTRVSSRRRIVQKNGKTMVTEEHDEGEVE